MKTKVKMAPTSTILANLGIQPNGPAEKYFTNMCYRRMGTFVPGGSSSELNKNVSLKADSITYKSPYAHYQYRSILYVDPDTGSSWARKGVKKVPTSKNLRHTIGTSYWDKKMWASQGEDAIKELQEYVDRGCR
jgi:hypothetical protein